MDNQASDSKINLIVLEAEPKPLQIDLQKAAVIVVDMQNTFISKGGMVDLSGRDISANGGVVGRIARINAIAKTSGIKVIYITHVYSPDLQEAGSSDSPNWHKEHSLHVWREHPEWRDRLLIRGTWGSRIIDELRPEEGDIYIEKRRYSAFFATDLDIILRTYGIKFLIFVGIATNVCVETSIRDSFNLGYFSILISDATIPVGPSFIHEATIYNVKNCFGWVTNTENLIKTINK